jgi:hypothetical protein
MHLRTYLLSSLGDPAADLWRDLLELHVGLGGAL